MDKTRAALEHVTELLVDTWHTAMPADYDPEKEVAVINAREALAALDAGAEPVAAWQGYYNGEWYDIKGFVIEFFKANGHPVRPLYASPPELTTLRERVAELEKVVLAVTNAVREHLPPDGISAEECLSRIIAATDNPAINPIIKEAERTHGNA